MKKAPNIQFEAALDPQKFVERRRGLLVPDSEESERSKFTRVLMLDFARHPAERDHTGHLDISKYATQSYQRIRDSVILMRQDGRALTVDEFLARPSNGSATGTISTVIEVLLELRGRRAQLLEQLEALSAIEALFTASEQSHGGDA